MKMDCGPAPHYLDRHTHGDILWDICEILGLRTGVTHMYKISVHVGHQGNEKADAKAKEGAVDTRGADRDQMGMDGYPLLGEDRLTAPKKQLRRRGWQEYMTLAHNHTPRALVYG